MTRTSPSTRRASSYVMTSSGVAGSRVVGVASPIPEQTGSIDVVIQGQAIEPEPDRGGSSPEVRTCLEIKILLDRFF